MTTYKAVKVGGVKPAERVAVFGIGWLGHLAVQYARIAGGFVVGVDVEDAKLDLARQLGADHVVNARTTDPADTIQDWGGADVAIAATGRKLEEVNTCFEEILAGHVPARLVLEF